MKKFSLLPLVAAMAVAGTAQAQMNPSDVSRFTGVSVSSPDKSVQLWGRVDLGLRNEPSNLTNTVSDQGDEKKTSLTNSSTNRWGIRGATGALKYGLRGIFNLEQRFNGDTGTMVTDSGATSQIWRDKSYIGLFGDWGLLMLGRQPSVTDNIISGRYEAFGGDSLASNGSRNAAALAREDNAIFYGSPRLGPVTLSAHLALSENVLDSTGQKINNGWGYGADFLMGPVSLSAGYQFDTLSGASTQQTTTTNNFGGNATTVDDRRTIAVGFSWDFGPVKWVNTYGRTNDLSATDAGKRTIRTHGLKIPAGPGEFRASYELRDDESANGTSFSGDTDVERLGLGYQLVLDSNNTLNFSYVREMSTKRFDATGNVISDRSGNGVEVAYRLVFGS